MSKVILYGRSGHGQTAREVDYDACVHLMDNDLREKLHSQLAGCSEQFFLDAYCESHREKFDEDFEI